MARAISQGVTMVLKMTMHTDCYEVDVSLVGDEEIADLNSEYRGLGGATDVLSFPLCDPEDFTVYDPIDGDLAELPDVPSLDWPSDPETCVEADILGDIVISMPRAAEQAAEYGHSLAREACYLAVHGALHLVGYDHETPDDRDHMRRLEEMVMAALGLAR